MIVKKAAMFSRRKPRQGDNDIWVVKYVMGTHR